MSSASASGSSKAAKWPPEGNLDHCFRLYKEAAQALGEQKSSLGKHATAVGTCKANARKSACCKMCHQSRKYMYLLCPAALLRGTSYA